MDTYEIAEWLESPVETDTPSGKELTQYLQHEWVSLLKARDTIFGAFVKEVGDVPTDYLFRANGLLNIQEAETGTILFTFQEQTAPTYFNEFILAAGVPFYGVEDQDELGNTKSVKFSFRSYSEDFFENCYDDCQMSYRNILSAKTFGTMLDCQPAATFFTENNYCLDDDREAPNRQPIPDEQVILYGTGLWEHKRWEIKPEDLYPNPFSLLSPDGILDQDAVMEAEYTYIGE